MQLTLILQFIVVYIVLSFSTTAMTQGITWTTKQRSGIDSCEKSSVDSSVRVWVNDQLTHIDDGKTINYLDYTEMRLYSYDKASGKCRLYKLENTETDLNVLELDQKTVNASDALLADIQVSESNEKRELNGYMCQKKTALLGAGLLRFKNFGPKVFKRFGLSLSEGVEEYWVSADLDIWPQLQTIIDLREQSFLAVPLLRRIDPLGLMGKLKGFPLQGSTKRSCQTIHITLTESPTGNVLIPELGPACLKAETSL